ncbi:unnamed protein product [Allacma fusca]|uniref:Uncharacterized protein n=1 Tax=Allacma fusca TaxID=39272 RepID=A0A8J2LQ28_9HEXA|nr:unnamed protein product [Allacma fusca]
MADKKETTPHLGVCSCIFLILNVLCNNGFNALVAVAALYPHLHFFSSSPGEDFESTCTNFNTYSLTYTIIKFLWLHTFVCTGSWILLLTFFSGGCLERMNAATP